MGLELLTVRVRFEEEHGILTLNFSVIVTSIIANTISSNAIDNNGVSADGSFLGRFSSVSFKCNDEFGVGFGGGDVPNAWLFAIFLFSSGTHVIFPVAVGVAAIDTS